MNNKWLGLCALALSLLIAFVWVPLDVESGLFEKVRRNVQIGDALAPTLAAFMIGLGGVLVFLAPENTQCKPHQAPSDSHSLIDNFVYACSILVILAVGLSFTRYSGPVVVGLFHTDSVEYRVLRDTIPWKYIGFVLGGTFLVTALIAWTERKLRWVHVLIAFTSTLVLIALYDLPFDDLLLPPNGDV